MILLLLHPSYSLWSILKYMYHYIHVVNHGNSGTWVYNVLFQLYMYVRITPKGHSVKKLAQTFTMSWQFEAILILVWSDSGA